MNIGTLLLMVGLAYLIGSIPVAYLIGRLHGVNVFNEGSGNMGAGNIARLINKKWAVLTWTLDSIKGVIAILVARQVMPADQYALATMVGAIAAIVGHNWSIFVLFITGQIRGGKGAATAIGTWFLFIPPLFIAIVMAIWVAIVLTTRYVSLAVLTTMGLISLLVIYWVADGNFQPVYLTYLVVTGMIFYRHRENIKALLAGKERRLGDKAQS